MDIEKHKQDLAHIQARIDRILENSSSSPLLLFLLEQAVELERVIAEDEQAGAVG